ncbi:ATP-binding protein [Flagellimonas sp.]|uniref:ATP-binding protein n=1 Tax=Flagellimonas sp. TaxID=2058762 RepID=UPI003F49DAB3
MRPKPKKRFTLKIISSYFVLVVLAVLASYLIYSEFQTYDTFQSQSTDNQKLLQTNLLLTELHEAENLSKLALQSGKKAALKTYSKKVDSVSLLIDSLKVLTPESSQQKRLDSVQHLLVQKAFNTAELRKIRLETAEYTPTDSLMSALKKMEVDMGRITPENLVSNFEELPPTTQESIKKYVNLLNENIPQNRNASTKEVNIDSLLQLSKSILAQAKIENTRLKQSLAQKEVNIYRTDLELSQKLRSIISSLQKEIIQNAEFDSFQKQKVIERSIRFGGIAAFLGLFVVILFTVLVSNDFLKVQRYRDQLEKEKAYSEALLQSREQLISTVSHDLKSPLATIQGYTDLLAEKNAKKKFLGYTNHMKSALTYVDTLLSDLLDFSRLEGGQLPIEKRSFLLSELLRTISAQYQDIPDKKNITFSWNISSELHTPILSDPIRLSQILNNLIGNAFKYTHKGFVKVDASIYETGKGTFLKIKVVDSGIGIKKEKQALIFKEFTQADDSIYGKYGGYGLGLTIAKKLSALLGGYMDLESREQQGSTFIVCIPLEFGTLKELPSEHHPITSDHNPHSLLIFEDDEALLELLLEVCKSRNIKAIGFNRFEDMEIPKDFQYSIVLTDINLPDIDGFGVLEQLKSKTYSHFTDQPVIAMTGQRNIERAKFIEAGFSEILPKPFSSETLLNALQTLTSKSAVESNGILQEKSIPSQSLFNLEPISSFLENQEALESVLATFLQNTTQNLKLLGEGLSQKEPKKVRYVGHQMLPMFRQLEVKEAIPILERLETVGKKSEFGQAKKDYAQLKAIFSKLKKRIHEQVFKHPIDTD